MTYAEKEGMPARKFYEHIQLNAGIILFKNVWNLTG
jgi:hypothetical protein